ncbi:MAG: hypothetical protein OYH77_04910 [Pseudomonadota bacterium]|nr:hypothetical protein [Pseudomonadota bacterium]
MFRSLVVLLALTVSSALYANNFDKGLNHYRTANFVQAKIEFQNALREGSSRSGYGKIYKYLGLSQYMLGETKAAKASFGYALHYDPRVELYPNEVLDSSVLEFFLDIKQKLKGKAPAPRQAKKAVASKAKKKPARTVAKPAVKSVAKPPVAAVPKLGTSRKPKKVVAAPVKRRTTVHKRPKVHKKTHQKHQQTRQVAKPRPSTPAAKKKKQPNMFYAKKPPKVIILDNSGAQKQPKKRGHSSYQDLLPVPSQQTKAVRVSGGISAWSFFPFGAGQYAAGRYKLGHVFALGSVGSLVSAGLFYYFFLEQNGNYERLIASEKYRSCMASEKCRKHKDNKTGKTLAESVEAINTDATMNQIGMWSSFGAFGLFWIGGAIEAVANRPTPIRYVYIDNESIGLAFNYQF